MVVNTQFHKFYGRSKKWRGIFRVAAEVCSSQTRLGLRTFFETFMHVYVRTLRTTKYIQGKKKTKAPSEVRCRDGHVLVCKNSGCISWTETAWTLSFGAENMYILRGCL